MVLRTLPPISQNPLLRWGSGLGWGNTVGDGIAVGAEGCRHAFNATNTVRTSHYFCTRQPPTFLGAQGPSDIASLQPLGDDTSIVPGSMLFGNDIPRHSTRTTRTVVLENYSPRCQSVHQTRLATPGDGDTNLIVGDENKGMSGERHDASDVVVFVPQYGTISSLNVVTTLGLGLYYAWMDTHVPTHRTLVDPDRAPLPSDLQQYFGAYSSSLPFLDSEQTDSGGMFNNVRPTSRRVDERPIHPGYYSQTAEAIGDSYTHLLHSMASWVGEQRKVAVSVEDLKALVPSVLYENDFDQRNFGGLIRNANAMLCREVLYVGKRRYNVKGAVGCNHYSKPIHLGSLDVDSTFTELERRLGETGRRLWLLSCGHEPQYQGYADVEPSILQNGWGDDVKRAYLRCSTSDESFRELRALSDQSPVVSLADSEESIVAALDGGVMLLVPQEGKAPHPRLLSMCVGTLQVLPPTRRTMPLHGLPSQVASGIALHRLLTTQLPELKV